MSIPKRIFVPVFLFLLAIAAFLRFWALDAGLPHLMTRPDEELLLFQTRDPASGVFHLKWPVMHPGIPSAYIYLLWIWGEVGVNLLQAVGAAPAGDYLQVLSLAPDRVLLLERAFSALAGVATVAVVTLGARRELGGAAALVAGLLVATAFLHVRDSHSAKPDVAMGLGVAVALIVMAPLWNGVRTSRVVATGVAIGLAMAMKPPAVLLFVPAWVALFMGSEHGGWRRLSVGPSLLLAFSAAVVFAGTSPFFVLSEETFERVVTIVGIVFPEIVPSNVAPPIPVIPGLESDPSRLAGLAYHVRFSLRYGVGLLMALLLPVAIARAFVVRAPLLVSSAVLFLVGLVLFGLSPALLSRYITPLVPAAALLVASLLAAGAQSFPTRFRIPVLAALAVLVVAESTVASVQFDRLAARTDTRVHAARWLEERTPSDATIAVAGTVLWSWGEPVPPSGRPWVRIELDDRALEESNATFLVTHDHPLFSSTIDATAVSKLGSQLALLAEFDPFVASEPAPLFETLDAYYIPTRGFDGVERPGPVVRIYAVH